MANWLKVTVSRMAVVTVTAALAVSCSPRGDDEAAKARPREIAQASRSALGAFLAGRFAQGGGDSRAAAEYYAAALRFDPDNVELLQRAFTLMVAEGRMVEAAPMAERLLAYDADAAVPLLVAGITEARSGHFAQAEARFAQLPKRGVNAFLGPLLTAWSRSGQGRTDAALESLAVLSQTNGLDGLRTFHAGLINDLADRAKAAEDSYQVALAGPLSIRTIEAAGSFYQRGGKPELAQSLYARYATEHPGTLLFDGFALLKAGDKAPRAIPDAKAGMAEALFDVAALLRQGNAVDASLVFTRLALAMQPDFPLAQVSVGDILSAQSRLTEANEIYRALNPASTSHAYGRLRVAMNLEELGQTDAALGELEQIARDRPGDIDALVTKGDVLRRKKRFAESAEAYGAALARLPDVDVRHWPLLYSRGIAFERSQQWPKAEADFIRALELKPDQPDVLNYLGYIWVDRGEKLEAARAMIEKAVDLRPKDGAIVDSLGWALYRLGDFHGAVKQLERAVELKAEDPTVNDHLGDAYWQIGRVEEALFQWRRTLTLEPEPEQVEPLREKLRTGEVPAKRLAK